MSSKKPLVATTDKMVKEEINDMETKLNVLEKYITHRTKRIKFDAINETDKAQASQSKKYKYIRNESNKDISLDKSRSLDK